MSIQRKLGLPIRVQRAALRDGPASRRWTEDQPRPKKPRREETETHGPEATVIRSWRAE